MVTINASRDRSSPGSNKFTSGLKPVQAKGKASSTMTVANQSNAKNGNQRNEGNGKEKSYTQREKSLGTGPLNGRPSKYNRIPFFHQSKPLKDKRWLLHGKAKTAFLYKIEEAIRLWQMYHLSQVQKQNPQTFHQQNAQVPRSIIYDRPCTTYAERPLMDSSPIEQFAIPCKKKVEQRCFATCREYRSHPKWDIQCPRQEYRCCPSIRYQTDIPQGYLCFKPLIEERQPQQGYANFPEKRMRKPPLEFCRQYPPRGDCSYRRERYSPICGKPHQQFNSRRDARTPPQRCYPASPTQSYRYQPYTRIRHQKQQSPEPAPKQHKDDANHNVDPNLEHQAPISPELPLKVGNIPNLAQWINCFQHKFMQFDEDQDGKLYFGQLPDLLKAIYDQMNKKYSLTADQWETNFNIASKHPLVSAKKAQEILIRSLGNHYPSSKEETTENVESGYTDIDLLDKKVVASPPKEDTKNEKTITKSPIIDRISNISPIDLPSSGYGPRVPDVEDDPDISYEEVPLVKKT